MSRLFIGLLTLAAAVAAQAESLAIVGGTVHTAGPAGTIDNATVIVDGGRIVSVESGGVAPAGVDVIDAAGKIITPGFFSPAGRLGLVEVSSSAGPVDAVQRGTHFRAGFDVADAFNPRSTLIAINRIDGVTRAAILPGASSPGDDGATSAVISGLAAVVNLSGDDDSIDRRGAAMVVHLGEDGAGLAGESRAAALLELRLALDEAVDYREHADAWERGQHRDYQYSRADLEALQRVLERDTALYIHVNRASDIRSVLRLSSEYGGLRWIVAGGVEAWMVADELSVAGVPVVLAPESNLPASFDRLNARDDNATILVNAGVAVAFADDSAQTHNARNLTQSAGNAIAEGMSREQALEALTLAPARMFGIADRLGSLEPGKEADLVIWPGDPFELTSYPDTVIIRGERVPMQSRQTLLRDRYLDVTSEVPPAYRD